MKTKIELELNTYELEINGKPYPIVQRTEETESKIRARDEKINKVSEYESNIELLNILLGESAVREIFPNGKSSNLDMIAKAAYYALKYYYHEKNAFESEVLNKQIDLLKTTSKAVKNAKLPS